MNMLRLEADIYGEGLDQVFALIPVVECPGAKEQCDGRVNRGAGASSQVMRRRARRIRSSARAAPELQRAEHRRTVSQLGDGAPIVCRQRGRPGHLC